MADEQDVTKEVRIGENACVAETAPTAEEEGIRLRIEAEEHRAARFGTAGRFVCAVAIVALCICIGLGGTTLQIVAGALCGAVVIGYIACAVMWTKKLDRMRADARTGREYVPTERFLSLARQFDIDELHVFSSRVPCQDLRAFRDERVLEVEFTLARGLVLSCEFDNTEARLIINDRREAAYRLDYAVCETETELFDAIVGTIDGLRDKEEK